MKRWICVLVTAVACQWTSVAQNADFKSGVSAYQSGQYEQAITNFQAALSAYSAKKDKAGMADANNYLGLLYQVLNQPASAAKYFEAAAQGFKAVGNKSGAASAFANWGIAGYNAKKDSLKANGKRPGEKTVTTFMAYHLMAQKLHQEIKDKSGEADDLNNIGTMWFEAGIYDQASNYYQEALKLHTEIKARGGLAYDLANLARLSFRTDDIGSALKYYQKSAQILDEIGDREGAWKTYSYIGAIFESMMRESQIRKDPAGAQENRKHAIAALKKSVDLIESLRGNFTNKDFFESYLKDKNPVYKRLIRLLKMDGNSADALYYIERSKAKMSNDVLNAGGKLAVADPNAQKSVDKAQELQKQKEDIEKALTEEKAKPVDKQDKAKIDNLSQSLTKNEGDFNALMIDLETKYPNLYQVIKVDPIQLADIQKQLPDDVVLLEYFPADDALYIFMITKDKIEAKSVPVANTVVDSLVNKFRYYCNASEVQAQMRKGLNTMTNWKESGDRFYSRHAKPLRDIMVQLYDYLILPVWDNIKDDKYKIVTVIPAGSLFYVPFQCLATETKDGDISFFIEKKSVNYLTAATLMDLVNKKKMSKINNVLVFGNPDGSLPGAEEEAKIIKGAFANAILYKNQEATKDKAKDFAGTTEVVHFATHGFLSSDEPQKSFLLMAPNEAKKEDNKLTISEILKLPLKEKNELVVLSACNTSMGKSATGVELISLSRAFAVAGAPTTVATLWPVDDESTKIIMVNFYDGLKKGLSKAESMRQAQIALIRKGDYHTHPFFWAPYVMIGNGK